MHANRVLTSTGQAYTEGRGQECIRHHQPSSFSYPPAKLGVHIKAQFNHLLPQGLQSNHQFASCTVQCQKWQQCSNKAPGFVVPRVQRHVCSASQGMLQPGEGSYPSKIEEFTQRQRLLKKLRKIYIYTAISCSLVIAALLYSALIITEIARGFLILLVLPVVGPFYAISGSPLPPEMSVLSDVNPD